MVGYDVTAAPGVNDPPGGDTSYVPVRDRGSPDFGRLRQADIGRNIIGFNEDYTAGCYFCQGSPISRALNVVPGINAIGGLDDYINNRIPSYLGDSTLFKAITIPTAVGLTLPALLDRVPPTLPARRRD
jgi:hypothetical protein